MNEQIKNSQIQQVVERYDNEKRFKNNTSVSHQELSTLDEIRESVKAIFSDYFGSVEFFHNLEDFDRRGFPYHHPNAHQNQRNLRYFPQ